MAIGCFSAKSLAAVVAWMILGGSERWYLTE